MFWFNKKDHIQNQTVDEDRRERLFFHDIINQTHGLLLFFSQRQSMKKGIKADEVAMLEAEVRTLQSLIKDHFQFKHKNLSSTYDWVPFSIAELALKGLIQTYLPAQNVQTFIHLKGHLSYDVSLEQRENTLIYFPFFYRIMNNLIKNMAEAKSDEVHFIFDYGNAGFVIETRNKFNGKEDLKGISDKLSQIILDEKPAGNGLGMESIHHLAQECGGVFDFEISNDIWINRITLPKAEQTERKKSA
ncbi:MAG: GHKL domain-containing protein [Bacteriovorax sp.]|jgi:hypothetical protein